MTMKMVSIRYGSRGARTPLAAYPVAGRQREDIIHAVTSRRKADDAERQFVERVARYLAIWQE